MKSKIFALSLATLALFGCGKDDKKDTAGLVEGILASKSYYLVDAGTLERTDSQIKGTGSVVFVSPLDGLDAKTNYNLTFTLEDGGSVELVAHSDSTLSKGVSVVLSRAGSVLNAKLKADGTETETKVLGGITASGVAKISIDVHNDENPSHILIWDGAGDAFAEDDALLNSEAETPGQGKSTAWGLVLTKATLTAATLAEPKFVEPE